MSRRQMTVCISVDPAFIRAGQVEDDEQAIILRMLGESVVRHGAAFLDREAAR